MRKITLDQLEDRVITIDRGLSQRINSVEKELGDLIEESKDRFAVVGEFMEEFKRRQK